jgi:hypothetical protein
MVEWEDASIEPEHHHHSCDMTYWKSEKDTDVNGNKITYYYWYTRYSSHPEAGDTWEFWRD